MQFRKWFLYAVGLTFSYIAEAGLIPNAANDLYYKLGGGQNVPMPAYMSTQTIPLSVDGSIGFGYNCGVFDQTFSIANSLNNIKNSFQNVQQQVVQNATSAIASFPMYAISRADPSLYNLLNNGLLGARKDFEVSTKNCQFMQSEIGQGKNPYQDWMTLSMGNDWKYQMGLTKTMSVAETSNQDINQISAKVQKDDGENGLPWVRGVTTRGHELYAGGKGQPPILVIYDTAIAGYNVILQRDYNNTSAPAKTATNERLVGTWSTPVEAAKWITTVAGDHKITTYTGGEKKSSPGIGLLPDTQDLTQKLTDAITALVTGQKTLTLQSLQEISAPRVLINEAVIQNIRRQTSVMQSIIISKLAQEVASARMIDKAQLAIQILEGGSQVPAIYGNDAARETIKTAVAHLRRGIEDLLFNVKVNKELVSNTVAELFQATRAQQINGASIPTDGRETPILQDGAILKGGA